MAMLCILVAIGFSSLVRIHIVKGSPVPLDAHISTSTVASQSQLLLALISSGVIRSIPRNSLCH